MSTGSKKKKKLFKIVFVIIFIVVIIRIISIKKLYRIVTIEAGTETLNASQFIRNEKNRGTFITDISTIDMCVPGVYKIEIQIGKKIYSSKFKVEDTVAPIAEVVNQEVWTKEEIEANEFVENIIDCTDVKVFFKEQPNFSKVGLQEVIVLLEDESGNKTELKVSLNVKEDTEPPEIIGIHDQTVYISEKVSYKNGVSVKDNRNDNLELVVDSSAVNIKKEGSYDVIYKATDSSGNTTMKTVIFKVKEKPKNYVNRNDLDVLADKILTTIITDDMSQKEKASAIYKWTQSHIRYVGYSNKSDWVKAAYQGINKAYGDCFVYYSTARELLTRANIENQPIVKLGGGHYWNLVYCENRWYHFDTTPRNDGIDLFMFTDAEIEEYSKKHQNSHIWEMSCNPS